MSTICKGIEISSITMADQRHRGVPNLLFGKICAENCMKMKEIGPGAETLETRDPPPP